MRVRRDETDPGISGAGDGANDVYDTAVDGRATCAVSGERLIV